jgi:hypothetical protein
LTATAKAVHSISPSQGYKTLRETIVKVASRKSHFITDELPSCGATMFDSAKISMKISGKKLFSRSGYTFKRFEFPPTIPMYWRYWCSHGFGQIFFVLLIRANDGKSDDPAGSSVSINYKRCLLSRCRQCLKSLPQTIRISRWDLLQLATEGSTSRHFRAALGDTHPSGDRSALSASTLNRSKIKIACAAMLRRLARNASTFDVDSNSAS